MVEKFTITELAALRNGLLQTTLDAHQAAELLQMFLAGRGYGIDRQAAVNSVTRLEGHGCSFDALQQELESLALVM